MGHDCYWIAPKTNVYKFTDEGFYISFNFSEYSHWWHISDAHGHTGKTILCQVEKVLRNLKNAGFKAIIKDGEDGWTTNENVFMFHLERLRSQCKHHLTDRLYSDQCKDHPIIKYVDEWNGCVSDGEEEPKDIKIEMPNNKEDAVEIQGLLALCGVYYVMHPLEGIIAVNTYDKAMGCYGRALATKDERAESWLKLAQTLPGSPNYK